MVRRSDLYPIGVQDFDKIRNAGGLYIDKTEYVYRMTHTLGNYYFLSRPRRFGKSLLLSTLRYYFEGRKDLFTGLAIDKLETEWTVYPVLRFDMSKLRGLTLDQIPGSLGLQINRYEELYGDNPKELTLGDRLGGVIERAYLKTGKQVVVLVDEYDAPMLYVSHDADCMASVRAIMANFYSHLKDCDQYLRFVFITGITKFSQLSIFSGLNNIKNISMLEDYAAICGITRDELTEQMSEDINTLAERNRISYDEALSKLIENYDGYHFSWPSPDILNPYSLLNAFSDGQFRNYWFDTGTPTFLIEMLRKFGVVPSEIGNVSAPNETFDAPTEYMTSYIPLFYQSGYLTIKGRDKYDKSRYILDFPNKEVRMGLLNSLIPDFVMQDTIGTDNKVYSMWKSLLNDDMDTALQTLQTFLKTVPYTENANSEGHYQQMLYVIFSLLGAYADVEVRTPKGRVDMVLRTKTCLYIVELKLNKDANAAMKQIDIKDYPSRFFEWGLPIVKVGINFDSEQRNITDWAICPI